MKCTELQKLASDYEPPVKLEEVLAECTAMAALGLWKHYVFIGCTEESEVEEMIDQLISLGYNAYAEDDRVYIAWEPPEGWDAERTH